MNSDLLKIISRVATVTFVAAALIYFLSLMLAGNGVSPDLLSLIADYIDIPLVLAGLTVAAAKVIKSFGLTTPEHIAGAIAVWLAAGAIFVGFLLLDFFATK